ncbi:MAG: DNA polymerase III subunit delta [Planctomycetota bacterium]|nr:MAG: DNA polymerase III subunit delta [Planctomycetota bacterium]
MSKTTSKSEKKHKPIYVITGKEDALVSAECEKLLETLLEHDERVAGLFNADPAQVSASAVLDELRTLPFLTKTRVVLVKGADKFVSENRQLLEKYFDNPCPIGVLILTVSNWDARTKLAKKLPRVGKLLSVTQPKSWQLPPRLIKYAADAHDKRLDKDAAGLLIELTGDDLPRLYGEIDKLALFAHTKKAITAEHVESLIGHNRIFSVFTVIDACLAGNVAAAIDRLRNMFAQDKSAEYTTIGGFAFHFRRMFNARALLDDGLSPPEIASRLGIWGNKDSFFSLVRKMPLKQIGSVLQQLAATDYAIKTGQTKTQVAAEQLVLKLAGR